MSKKALLVGINYFKTPAQLNGCITDIKNVRNMLIDAYDYRDSDIVMLRDDDPTKMPTRQNIINALNALINSSANSSEIWFHYSGHGTGIADKNGDEADRKDEAIVPSDYTTAGLIVDDDLFQIVKNSKCKTIMMFDCCHSGTGCDLQFSYEYVNGSFRKTTNNAKVILNPNIFMMSGCKDSQTSADAFNNVSKEFVGAFTDSLLECLRASQHNIDILKLYNNVCFALKQKGFTQLPILSCSSVNILCKFTKSITNTNMVPLATSVGPNPKPVKRQVVLPSSKIAFRIQNMVFTNTPKMI